MSLQEKIDLYMSLSKEDLVSMLIEANELLNKKKHKRKKCKHFWSIENNDSPNKLKIKTCLNCGVTTTKPLIDLI